LGVGVDDFIGGGQYYPGELTLRVVEVAGRVAEMGLIGGPFVDLVVGEGVVGRAEKCGLFPICCLKCYISRPAPLSLELGIP